MLNRKETRAVLLGAAMGGVAGAALALLLQRRPLPSRGGRKPVRAGQVVRLGSAVAAVVRQVMEMLA